MVVHSRLILNVWFPRFFRNELMEALTFIVTGPNTNLGLVIYKTSSGWGMISCVTSPERDNGNSEWIWKTGKGKLTGQRTVSLLSGETNTPFRLATTALIVQKGIQ